MFTTARIRLTIWYLLIIMLVSVMFSFSLYRISTTELEQGFHRILDRYTREYGPLSPKPQILEPAYLEAEEARVAWQLVYINVFILIISGVGGYILAGLTLRPIKNMLDEQNRFITDASHELKTPITSLKSEIEVYLRSKHHNTKEADKLLKSNLEEVNNLQTLSESLLSLAQVQKPPKPHIYTNISLKHVLQKAIKKGEKMAKQKQIILHAALDDYTITGEEDSLLQTFSILLDNAIKYSPERSEVIITTQKIDGHVQIAIADNGIGIAEKDIPHIFDRFYRADISRTKQAIPGYGLGLSIAKNIITQHNGNIKVKSIVDKGTTFIIQLPLAK